MRTKRLDGCRRGVLALAVALPMWLAACSTPTAVSSSSEFEAQEGLVVLRLVDVGNVPISRFTVVSEQTGEEHPLRAIRFGQTVNTTYVGRLPAGRYQPKNLTGSTHQGTMIHSTTVPLAELTGSFDVEASRVTQLGTMVFVRLGNAGFNADTLTTKVRFALPLDPTPVPVEPMLASRFPQLAKAAAGKPPLGWVSGTVPVQPSRLIDVARAMVQVKSQPAYADATTIAAGGSLGVLVKTRPGQAPARHAAPTVHAITSVLALQDGRWLAGGEEGYLALSSNEGRQWQALPALPPDEVVLHLTQRSDGKLLMVTDGDRAAVVYESADHPIAWKEIHRIATDREQHVLMQPIGEAAHFLPDHAVSTKDRLVIFTQPGLLSTLDYRSNQWVSHPTPRPFPAGIKVTPDGYVIGMGAQFSLHGSDDLGKTWKRLEAWMQMTEPHFYDRRRGVMLAVDTEILAGGRGQYKIRTTDDGGATWKTGDPANGWYGVIGAPPNNPFGRLLKPLWTDPSGRWLHTMESSGRISTSKDGGRSWD